MVEGLKKACSMNECSLNAMKQAALDKAHGLFDMENYRNSFSVFLAKAQEEASARKRR